MKLTARLSAAILLLFAALILATAPAPLTAGSYCIGIKPIKPITGVGCSDMVALCLCDDYGSNCAWRWVCVKN